MGQQLGSLCHELREELDWLQNKWAEFQQLFSSGAERIEVLNTVAPNFFWFLHKMMFEDAMLHVCRLTDPAETRVGRKSTARKNLTVMALPNSIPDPVFRDEVKAHVRESREKCESARQVRNRRLAHGDLESILHGNTGPKIVRSHIEEAIDSLRRLIWCVEEHYGYPPSALLRDPFGAQPLVAYLESAVRRECELRHDRLRSG
jgi:hypothetical protein